ncbi:MAG: glycosyltransferase [Saprospiraceae bacterium]|nr:glycosyltransferase [Saprospiraceae bacterium]
MKGIEIQDLPTPFESKTGFPWTVGTEIVYHTFLPKITIITPSYNQGEYIEETIRSVLLQGYPNLEYMIIDGGSTDRTIEIIKKYEKFLHYWVSERDKGQADAINKGIEKATGEVFNWLNSDDVYLPNTLLKVGGYFLDKKVDVLCGREIQRNEETGEEFLTHGTLVFENLEQTIAWAFCDQPPTFMRLDIVKNLGKLETCLHFCMDAELWVNYLTHFGLSKVKKADDVFNVFRLHKQAKSSSQVSIYYQDRFNILFALAQSLKNITFPKQFVHDNKFFDFYLDKKYNWLIKIDENLLSVHISERLLNYHSQYMLMGSMLKIYFFILIRKPLGWSWRLYFAPLIKIKRWVRPL